MMLNQMLGKVLAGRYKIVSHLGGGGFGQTYLAEDTQLPENPKCVVKQLQPLATRVLPKARELFAREAKILQKLGKYDHIPRLYAYFEEEQEFYLVQEYVEGSTLSEDLQTGKRLNEIEVIALLQETLTILECVHQNNVIHRDIKPSNLIRRYKDGKLYLIDFGTVKQISAQGLNPQGQTAYTIAISTLGYTPREQLEGNPTFNSDIYALGITAIQALTGINPRQLIRDADTGQVIWRHRALVSDPLAAILDKMIRPDWRERYQSVSEVLNDLKNLTNTLYASTQKRTDVTQTSTPFTQASPYQSQVRQSVENGKSKLTSSLRLKKPWHILVILAIVGVLLGIFELIFPTVRPIYHLRQGEELLEVQLPEEALESFQKIIDIKPNNAKAWKGRGEALYKMERYDAALAAYDKALQLQPNDPETWNRKGRALYQLQRSQEALKAQEKALEIAPNNAQALSDQGIALIGLRRYEEALAAFDKARRIQPQDPTVWQNKALALEYLGRRQEALKVYEEALATYDEALKADPDDAIAWVDRGSVFSKLQRLEEAINSYEKAIEVDPDFYLAWHNKGNALYFLQRYGEALDAYDKALEIRPQSYLTWHSRGSLLAAGQKDFVGAIRSFDRALEIRPSFYHAWRDRGLALSDLGRHQEAIRSFDQALKIEPNDYQSWMSRGISLMALERNREALAAFDKAKDIQPNDPFIWANRGLVLEEMERNSEAIASYKQALEIDPTFQPASKALERLR